MAAQLTTGLLDRDAVAATFPDWPDGKVSNDEYIELKKMVADAGLLKKRHVDYAWRIFWVLGTYAAGFVMLGFANQWWQYLLLAVYMTFTYAQVSMLSHDAGHRQMFKHGRLNDYAWLLIGGFAAGSAYSWWNNKHNAHHANPNDEEIDPDIDLPLYAYSEAQALEKTGVQRFMVKYQAPFFFLVQLVVVFFMRFNSFKFLTKQPEKVRYPFWEWATTIANTLWTPILVAVLIGPLNAIWFMLLWYAMTGVHLGMVFAPNHKGMPLVSELPPMDYLRLQVITARNVKPSWFNDWFYGGLNYQIEHHLFPTLPRKSFRATQKIVSQYCRDHNIPYVEVGFIETWQQILGHLHEVSAVLRQKPERSIA